ncbi:MAG: hypothetical protein A2748_00090 [Candidatus Wildermuthbacteria bacterium RIFCSPHIGHO2_01_FULL_45_20]|uniref:Uncharacterized protein n=1 Tax=Candidatus Wildermuthbacteria bacterium RIFCSPHIGHO2_02_FULL_45_25 TaxID=1802450 RepID=A0A1G2R398_9BACT|nr:MAG: hypothetical protein A2748_00090 [Candidatus Wildermuthbacteria bacterium RIFCSPHIGHO2_01_FULL_45_20]OHA67306.1 MAG: hypothetical protein A3C04_01115 [Candidatus Wildermuthbacteria bacterium RIFCSPHIGHO2_02_FULL_45_25]
MAEQPRMGDGMLGILEGGSELFPEHHHPDNGKQVVGRDANDPREMLLGILHLAIGNEVEFLARDCLLANDLVSIVYRLPTVRALEERRE